MGIAGGGRVLLVVPGGIERTLGRHLQLASGLRELREVRGERGEGLGMEGQGVEVLRGGQVAKGQARGRIGGLGFGGAEMTNASNASRRWVTARARVGEGRTNLVILRLELLWLGHVDPTLVALAVGLALEPELLTARVHHRAVVVVHVGREHDLLLVAVLEALQLLIDVDAGALGDGTLAGGQTTAVTAGAATEVPATATSASSSASAAARHRLVARGSRPCANVCGASQTWRAR